MFVTHVPGAPNQLSIIGFPTTTTSQRNDPTYGLPQFSLKSKQYKLVERYPGYENSLFIPVSL